VSGTPQLLHDPSRERDACGIGLVADVRGRASRELLDRALAGLAAVSHRGAWAADGVTGDGAGVLLPLSQALTGERGAGIGMCFLREPWLKNVVEEACRAEGLEPAGWREVPHDVAALGSTATASMPRIAQLLLAPTALADAEARSTRARRRAEIVPGIYVASLSFTTVTYKALCAATQLSTFYPDLADPAYAVPWAIFHQRFSTNTEPSWERAQPFRFLCHNGEINTIEGNVGWMEARGRARGVEEGLAPSLDPNGSDSALLDNALELLVRSGREVAEAVTMLVPPAWQNDPRLEPEVRDLHRYGAMLVEPCPGAEQRRHGHHRALAVVVDRGVGDLGETLAEVRGERAGSAGERRDRGVVPHRVDRVVPGLGDRAQHRAELLACVAEQRVARAEVCFGHRGGIAGRGPHGALLDPASVRPTRCKVPLELAVVPEPAFGVDADHLPRAETGAPHLLPLGQRHGTCLRRDGDDAVGGDGDAKGA
jgi:glutamate synthase domain-containing protein 1